MAGWIVSRDIPYEGIHEEHCESAIAVRDYLERLNPLDREDVREIRPASYNSYDLWNFLAALDNGEVE